MITVIILVNDQNEIFNTAIIMLIQKKISVRTIYIVYTNVILLNTDSHIWSKLETFTKLAIHKVLTENLPGLPKNAVLILDEADYPILDLAFKFSKDQTIIGLTGTPENASGYMEKEYLSRNNFRTFNSYINDTEPSRQALPIDSEVFFDPKRSNDPRLVFVG